MSMTLTTLVGLSFLIYRSTAGRFPRKGGCEEQWAIVGWCNVGGTAWGVRRKPCSVEFWRFDCQGERSKEREYALLVLGDLSGRLKETENNIQDQVPLLPGFSALPTI